MLLFLTVDKKNTLFDFELIPGNGHAALDVILPFIHRTGNDFPEIGLVTPYAVASKTPDQLIIALILHLESHRIPFREVENHNVVVFDFSPPGHSVVWPFDPFHI